MELELELTGGVESEEKEGEEEKDEEGDDDFAALEVYAEVRRESRKGEGLDGRMFELVRLCVKEVKER